MTDTSRLEIERWQRIITKCGDRGVERLRWYVVSKTLGRDFGESCADYLARRGLTEFDRWAHENYLERG